MKDCTVPGNLHNPPTKGTGISLGVGIFKDKKSKECMKLNWNFQRLGVTKIPSVGE